MRPAYYTERRLSRNGIAPQPFWQYVKAKNIKRKPRHAAAGGIAAVLAILMGELVHFPVMDPVIQIFTGAFIGLAVGLLLEFLLVYEAVKPDAGAKIPASGQVK